jgi:hypothetical protein
MEKKASPTSTSTNWIELLDSEHDNSGNETASANLNDTEGTDPELSDTEND